MPTPILLICPILAWLELITQHCQSDAVKFNLWRHVIGAYLAALMLCDRGDGAWTSFFWSTIPCCVKISRSHVAANPSLHDGLSFVVVILKDAAVLPSCLNARVSRARNTALVSWCWRDNFQVVPSTETSPFVGTARRTSHKSSRMGSVALCCPQRYAGSPKVICRCRTSTLLMWWIFLLVCSSIAYRHRSS